MGRVVSYRSHVGRFGRHSFRLSIYFHRMWLQPYVYVCTTKPYAVHLLALLLDGIV